LDVQVATVLPIRHPFPLRQASLYWLFVLWLTAIFMMGGSARGDISSLLVLRPAAILTCTALLATARREQLATTRTSLLFAGAAIGLVALHLIPLPPSFWQALPERELIARIDRAVGLGALWRPISIAPGQTWNALYALAVPLSVILFMGRLQAPRWHDLVVPILLLGLLCMILGILQTTSVSSDSPLYPYRVSNFGSPIGLFANRNHTGAFMASMLPLLAVFGTYRGDGDRTHRVRAWIAGLAVPIVLLFLLLLGSRAGLLLGLTGLSSMPFIYEGLPSRARAKKRLLGRRAAAIAAAILAAGVVIALGLAASRAESLERLLGVDDGANYRITTFLPILRLAGEYLPLGSGIGTFVEAWHRYEPYARLEPRYLNHAHNDLLELALTGGLPALVLVIAFAVVISRTGWEVLRSPAGRPNEKALKKAAIATLCLFALASIVDYPLRTPALSALAALMFVVLTGRKAGETRVSNCAVTSRTRRGAHYSKKMDVTQ